MSEKNIVIVGGGIAGVFVATDLEKRLANKHQYRIIVVEKKSHFFWCIGALRSTVDEIEKQLLIPYTNLFKNPKRHRVVQASVVRIEKHAVHLDNPVDGSTLIPFSHLIITTGTAYPAPSKLPTNDYDQSLAYIRCQRERIKKANSILIVGGGAAGVELVGELLDAYQNTKQITIVHSKPAFLGDKLPGKLRARFHDKMTKGGVRVILNDRVILPHHSHDGILEPTAPVRTVNGETINADLAILTYGNKPDTDWLKASNPELLADNGYIRTKPTLQVDVPGWEHVFTAGDVADINEMKQASNVTRHVAVLGPNVLSVMEGRPPSKTYTPGKPGILITFGKNQGGGALPLPIINSFNDYFASLLKSRGLMINRAWAVLNSKPVNTESSGNSKLWWVGVTGTVALVATYLAVTQKQVLQATWH